MGFYDHFANRQRNRLGVAIKLRQARKLFEIGQQLAADVRKILELGPGDGYIARLASKSNCEYLGIEASPAVAHKLNADGCHIIQTFVPPMPEGLGSYDLVFMLHIIEHMKDIDSASLLLEQTRQHLTRNGKLLIASPDFTRWKHDFYDCDYTHNLPFTARRLRQLLENTGYEVSYENVYVGPVFGLKALPLYWVVKGLYRLSFASLFAHLTRTDMLYKGYLTFLPCIIVGAGKNDR